MWSDRYYYLNIYYDKTLSVAFDTKKIQAFLNSMPEFIQVSDFRFRNSDIAPFADLLLLHAECINSWNDNDTDSTSTNLITIVCSKGNKNDFGTLKHAFIKVEAFLNWQLIDELTDDEIEDYVLWAPAK